MANQYHQETLNVHQNYKGDEHNSIARAIYPSTAFSFNDADHGADLFNLEVAGNIYTRLTNPTNDDLGTLVSDLEGGVGGLAVATGAAAMTLAIMVLCKAGDHIVASKELYGGTIALLSHTLHKFGITTTFVDQKAPIEELAAAFRPETKILLAEIIGNPNINVLDIEKFSTLAKQQRVPLVIDSTFSPPYLFRPIEHGADIVIHSATKYLSGHGNTMSGVIVDSGKFDWNSGKFPEFSQPDPAYHGLNYSETFGNLAFIVKARTQALRDSGMTLNPFGAYMTLNGIQTLHVRMDYVSKNALELAKWLQQRPDIEWVSYPLLESHPDYERAKRYFPKGAGGILAFGIKGGREQSKNFINNLKLGIHAVNVGDVRTIITHPASTTHRQLAAEELAANGITEGFIRLSVGLEHIDDIKADLDQALKG